MLSSREIDRRTVELAAALVGAEGRDAAAAALAGHVGADALVVLVADRGALVPAPGLPAPLADATWTALLARCARRGRHQAEVAWPREGTTRAAVALAGDDHAVVVVGGEPQAPALDALAVAAPLVAVALAAELRAGPRDDELLGRLCHELRNPLSPILTALQVMQLDGRISREQEVIERQVRRLLGLLDDLGDVRRAARGRLELDIAPVSLVDVVARAIELARPQLDSKRQVLDVDVPRGLVVAGDDGWLARALAKLVINASTYADVATRVAIGARDSGDRDTIELRVRDHGIGIPADQLERIFEPFAQVRAPGAAAAGLGLGLTVARAIVERCGGTIRAVSDGPGTGATLIVQLRRA